MLIEFHLIQNHAPSNLNRDDTGSPKECVFGGVKRGRISSQCLKRTIRTSDVFQHALEGALGHRTRQLPELVRQNLTLRGLSAEIAAYAAERASGIGNKSETTVGPDKTGKVLTAQTMFLTDADVNAVADALYEIAQGKTIEQFKAAFEKKKAAKKKAGDAAEEATEEGDAGVRLQRIVQTMGYRPLSVDVALFGRMITSEAFRDVEACVQVAHALSTHKVDHEYDYFTAVDDLRGGSEIEEDAGADMIGDVEFNSACYYKYFSIHVDGLIDNLTGQSAYRPGVTDADRANARDLAARAVQAFLKAAVLTTPSGKQNTFAAHQLPSAVLVEVRPVNTPVSYANAFVKPAYAGKGHDLIEDTLLKFQEHIAALTAGYNLAASHRLLLVPLDTTFQIPGVERVNDLNALCARLAEVTAHA